jgi:hypothetical protein
MARLPQLIGEQPDAVGQSLDMVEEHDVTHQLPPRETIQIVGTF